MKNWHPLIALVLLTLFAAIGWFLASGNTRVPAAKLADRGTSRLPEKRDAPPFAANADSVPRSMAARDMAGPEASVSRLPKTQAARSLTLQSYLDMLSENLVTSEAIAEVNTVIERLLAEDPAAAREWLAVHEGDPRFDRSRAAVAQRFVSTGDFESAQQWVEAIREPEARENALEEYVAEAYRHRLVDQAGVERSGLPVQTVRSILSQSRLD